MKKFFLNHPIEILFSILFLTLAAVLNLQFLEGANINHSIAGHDEYLTVREVYSILNPLSWKHFVLAIIGGDILYYGRVMFYTDALFAYVPFKIWGLDGMVYAIRMTHSVWILISFLILNNLFIKTKLNQFLFLFGSAGVMYSIYFVQMPKPEPLQLFFIAMFLRGLFKNNYKFGSYYFWLGLALAIKINVLLLLPLMFLLPLIIHKSSGFKANLQSGFKGLMWFLIGFFVGIPCLLLTPIQPVYLKTYLHETVFGTTKFYDDSNLGFIKWLESGLGDNYLGSHLLAYVFVLLAFALTIYTAFNYLKNKDKKGLQIVVISAMGLILMLSVMVLTKRLWPHYLWTGFVLIWLSFIIFSEVSVNRHYKKISVVLLIVFFGVSTFTFYIKVLPIKINRYNSKEMLITRAESAQLYQYLESNFKNKEIGIDGSVFYPYRHFIHSSPYHPFASERPKTATIIFKLYADQPDLIWECDVVVFKDRYPPLLNSSKNTLKAEDVNKFNSIFEMQTNNNFVLDTMIGENRIFKRTKDN
jgi:hypothetical protein